MAQDDPMSLCQIAVHVTQLKADTHAQRTPKTATMDSCTYTSFLVSEVLFNRQGSAVNRRCITHENVLVQSRKLPWTSVFLCAQQYWTGINIHVFDLLWEWNLTHSCFAVETQILSKTIKLHLICWSSIYVYEDHSCFPGKMIQNNQSHGSTLVALVHFSFQSIFSSSSEQLYHKVRHAPKQLYSVASYCLL